MTIGLTDDDPITAAEEQELVRRLMSDWHWGQPIRRLFDEPSDAKYYPEVSQSVFGGRDGDVDVVCVSKSQPDSTIAVEFKVARLRRRAHEANTDPNNLEKLPKLVHQANARFDLGFSRVFACLLVLIDGNPNDIDSRVHGGLSAEQNEVIQQKLGGLGLLGPTFDLQSIKSQGDTRHRGLDRRIGFVRIDLVQRNGSAPLTSGEIRANILRPAIRQKQSTLITQWSRGIATELR